MSNYMGSYLIHSGAITAGSTSTSGAIKLARGTGFSIIVDSISGTSPNYDVSYQVSSSADGTFISPADNVIINDTSTTTAVGFTPVAGQYAKFTVTNNNGSNALTITVKLTMQEE